MLTWREWRTIGKRVSSESVATSTSWDVVNNLAVGIGSTRTRTGISALEINAGFISCTFRVDGTLGTAVGRLSDVIHLASAHGDGSFGSAKGIVSTRRGHAGVALNGGHVGHSCYRRKKVDLSHGEMKKKRLDFGCGWWLTCDRRASNEGVPTESRLTRANRAMVNSDALGVKAAVIGARVHTALVHTS